MKIKRSLLKMVSLSCLLVFGSNSVVAAEMDTANPNEAETPLSGELGLSANGGYDPNPPSNLNKKTGINNSYLGMSYIPQTFDFGSAKLKDDVNEQKVSTTNKGQETFNIGVKDKRRQDNQHWSLNVKHTMSIDNGYQGVSLTVPINGEVKRNMNDGLLEFQEDDLIDQIKKYGSDEVKKAENNTINITTEENTIMHTTGGQFVNGVYDLELGDVTLNIPDASRVPAQEIKGTVEWTLSNTPMKQSYLTEQIRNLFKDGNCKELKTTITSEQVEAAKQSIESIEDEKQKTYNQEYFEKYVEGHFIEWCGRGIYSIDFAKLCYFKNATNSSAEVLFKKEKNKPNYCFGRQEYMRVTIQRGDDLILDEHIEGNDTTPLSTTSAVVQPGDTIEIYHVEGKNDRLGVYPSQYKTGGTTEGNRRTLKYQVTDSLDLKAM